MKNTKQTNNNTEDENSLSEERQDVTCSEGEDVTELSQSSGSDFYISTLQDELERQLNMLPKLLEKIPVGDREAAEDHMIGYIINNVLDARIPIPHT